jgi:Putative phage tail protein
MANIPAGANGSGPERTGGMICAGQGDQDPNCCKSATGFGAIFCGAICVFCCLECDLGNLEDTAGNPPNGPPTTTPVVTPTFPTVTPIPGENTPSFTSSAFGAGIPIVFGSDRLPGNVFWHSAFTKHVIPGTDGQDTHYYTTDFAIGICEGQINAILRMWIGDQLVIDNSASVDANGVIQPSASGYVFGSTIDLIGEDSPLKGANIAKTKITALNGSRYQLPQGVYSSVEGYSATPGYRGLAYILFENYVIYANSVPTITVEVSANTQNLYPRLYGARPLVTPIFNRTREALLYDPSFDIFYLTADNTTTNKIGYISFNGNNLEAITEHDWITGNDQSVTGIMQDQAWTLQSGNILHSNDAITAAGLTVVGNPFANVIVDTNGRAGSLLGHASGGLSVLGNGSICTVGPGSNGIPTNILVGMSAVGTGSKALGFMEVDDNGQLSMRGFFNNSMGGADGRLVPVRLGAQVITDNPKFSDDTTTNVACVYAFTYNTGEKTAFSVDRYTYAGNGATLAVPLHAYIGTINFGDIAGIGFEHIILRAMQDPVDNCIVLVVHTPTLGSYFVKWSPFTGLVLYAKKTPEDMPFSPSQGDATQLLTSQKYCWISGLQSIYTTDLATGNSTLLVDNFGDQDLPAPLTPQNAFYNGSENSLTYMSGTVGKELTKVFLERYTRNTVTLSEITRQLLARVGWRVEDLDVTDLQALSVIGYTVHQPKDLRSIFSELRQVFRFDLLESNGKILYKTRGTTATENIDAKYLADQDGDGHLKEISDTDFAHLRKLNLSYRDINRDYNANVQSIFLPKYQNSVLDNDAAIEVNVPVVLDSVSAKKLAEILLYSKLVYENAYEGTLDPRFQTIDPGDVYNIIDGTETITVRMRDVIVGQDKHVKFTASKEDPDIYNDQVNLFGNAGRYNVDTFDETDGRIDPFIMPIPFRSRAEAAGTSNRHYVFLTFLNSRASTVFSKPVTMIVNGVDTYSVPAPTNFPTWGLVTTPPNPVTSFYSTDNTSRIRVKMLSITGAVIASATKDELLANSSVNLAYVGGELIQFQSVINEGGGYYTFTGLHRAKFGTEASVFTHNVGEQFILLSDDQGTLDTGSIRRVAIPTTDGPRRPAQLFVSSNNPFQPAPTKIFITTNLRPWRPTGGKGRYIGDDCLITWNRRNRYDGEWPDDGTEQLPFYDGTEEYTLFLYKDQNTFSMSDPATYLRKVIVLNDTAFNYDAATQALDGFDNNTDTLYILVYQSGNLTGVDTGTGTRIVVSFKR